MGFGSPKTRVYLFISNKEDIDNTYSTKKHWLRIYIKSKCYVLHICSMHVNLQIPILDTKYYISLDTYTTLFTWGTQIHIKRNIYCLIIFITSIK